jgi:hypothetical protein
MRCVALSSWMLCKHTHDEMTRCDEHGIPDFWCPFLVRKRGFVPAWTKQNRGFRALDALLSRVWCFVFCKIFARWVYKNTKHEMTRCVALEFDALHCVKYLQDGFTWLFGTVTTGPWRLLQNILIRALNPRFFMPIFDAPFWSENWVSCPHERNKSGIPCSGPHNVAQSRGGFVQN